MNSDNTTRRDVLRSAGIGIGALMVGSGQAGASGKGRYNVGISSGAAERAARSAAESVHREFDWGGGKKTLTLTLPDKAAANLRRRAGTRYVEVDGEMHALGQTLPWGIDRVDAEKVHADGETGGDDTDGDGGADIAIIDTGIDDDHPDLQANIGTGKAFVDCKGRNCNEPWSDDDNHGTHCAGIADAADNMEGVVGVSTEATLHAVKVLDKNGSGSFSDVAAGIEWTADQGYDVGSMSLGASSGSQTVKDACQYAYDNGVLLVASAGNSGPCSDCVGYPAAYSTVIAVSSTDSDDSLSGFSSTGSEVELAAPGGSIYSTVIGGYDTYSGTSMSCPHVSGAAAQLMDNGDTNTEARDQLNSTAEDIGLSSNEQGSGLLDVEAALGGSGSTNNAPTVDSLSLSEVETSDGDAEFDADWSVSDSDGNLSLVDLTLTDDTAGETDDTASVSVSGDTASGTTRLVAASDEGTGNSYTVEVTVTDGAGNTASATASATESESAPAIDSLSASEVETSDSDAEFDVSWDVSDADGDLDSVDLTLTQDSDDSTEDSATASVSGSSDSGTTRLVAAGDDGSGNSYTVNATVTDSNGNTGSGSTSVSETENTSSAPTVDSHAVSTRTTGPWYRVTADWAVSDEDGDLSSVDVAIKDGNGNTLDSTTVDVSGSSASGSTELKTRNNKSSTSVVTVTDSTGNSDTSSKSLSF